MKKPTTIKDLCEAIWYLEEKYSLFDLDIDGIKVWQSARMHIYYLIAQKLGILSNPHHVMKISDKFKVLLKYIKNSIFFNPLIATEADVIVFPHSRTKIVDERHIDIYTDDIVNKLQKEQIPFVMIEAPYKGDHKRDYTSSHVYYEDFLILLRQLTYFIPLKEIPHSTIKNVEDDMKNLFGIEIELLEILSNEAKRFKIEYTVYKKILNRINPQKIYLTVGYMKSALIKAAKDINITTIEIQHGTYSRYHLGYSFSSSAKKKLAYFPDRFYVWSVFWKNLIHLPIDEKYVVVHGFAYMESQKRKICNITKIRNQVVILSQGAIGEKIADILLDNIKFFEGYSIKYKLHPGEYECWQQYTSLKKLLTYPNIELVKECDLYSLLAQSKYQMGVFSTAIYEGIACGCKTLLFDLPGIEYMEDLLENGIAKLYYPGRSIADYE